MRRDSAEHSPYLLRKGVRNHGGRIAADDALLLPICDATGEMWNPTGRPVAVAWDAGNLVHGSGGAARPVKVCGPLHVTALARDAHDTARRCRSNSTRPSRRGAGG